MEAAGNVGAVTEVTYLCGACGQPNGIKVTFTPLPSQRQSLSLCINTRKRLPNLGENIAPRPQQTTNKL